MRIQEKNKQQEMWKKISDFKFDSPTSSHPFSSRLSKENGWSREYSKRVVEEYRKFLYLSVISGKSLTPSEEVDQAWHLHMIYTHSYWTDLCKETLGTSLHHGPTKGGTKETVKYKDQYQFTLDFYESEFGEKAPEDIWPNVKKRFEDINYKRVNMNDNIVLNKEKVKKHLIVYSLALIGFFACLTLMSSSPTDNSDYTDLILYFLAGLAIVFLLHGLYRYITREKRGNNNYNQGDIGNYYSNYKTPSQNKYNSSIKKEESSSSKKTSSTNNSDNSGGTGCTITSSFIGCTSNYDSDNGGHGGHSNHGSHDGGHDGGHDSSSSDSGHGCSSSSSDSGSSDGGSSGCSSGCGGGGCGGGCGS